MTVYPVKNATLFIDGNRVSPTGRITFPDLRPQDADSERDRFREDHEIRIENFTFEGTIESADFGETEKRLLALYASRMAGDLQENYEKLVSMALGFTPDIVEVPVLNDPGSIPEPLAGMLGDYPRRFQELHNTGKLKPIVAEVPYQNRKARRAESAKYRRARR